MKIRITASLEEAGLETLRKYAEVEYEPFRKTRQMLSGDALVRKLEGVDILITETDNLTASVIEKLDTLKVICTTRGTPVNVDIPAATRHGIVVLNTPGRNCDAVADLAVCLMIMLCRHIPQVEKLLRNRKAGDASPMTLFQIFFTYQGAELWEKTVGLIGLGAVGQAVAKRLNAFGARVIACDPYQRAEVFEQLNVRSVGLETVMRESDIVSVHVMPTPETKGMIGAAQFAMMKPTTYFVNTARAVVTDEEALVQVLQDKKIAGAALDVYMKEPPPPDSPFLQMDNVIAMPHIGGNTAEIAIHQSRIAVPDIERLILGQKPEHCLNPEALEGFKLQQRRGSDGDDQGRP